MFSFTSLSFIFIFLPVSLIGYLLVSLLRKSILIKSYLLIVSLLFWSWLQFETFPLLLLLILQLYFVGNVIYANRLQDNAKHKISVIWLFVGILSLCFILFYYKLHNVISQLEFGKTLYGDKSLIIPIGLSFIVFSCISYIVDIYRGDAKPSTLLDTALYITFFPKLLSGPIVLWKDFHFSEHSSKRNVEEIWHGIERICIGYAKKVIIADTLGRQITEIHSAMQVGIDMLPPAVDRPTYWICALLYMFQIYYDFSGYSDIVIGLSEVLGLKVKENFDFPYTSRSVSEFWRRWHISLGTWFREYVYIPLGGNRKGCVYANLFIVFLLTGIWHGIGWTFLVWGIVNGILICLERFAIKHNWNAFIPSWLKHVYLIGVLYFSWILFSSTDLNIFFEFIKNMFLNKQNTIINYTWKYYLNSRTFILLIVAILGCCVSKINFINMYYGLLLKKNVFVYIRAAICLALFCISIMFIVNSSYSPFIYFQF